MAFSTTGTNLGSGVNASTAATSTIITTVATANAGELVLLFVAKDNANATDGDFGEVTSISDSAGGNSWVEFAEYTNGQGGAALGATVAVWGCVLTNAIASGGTITINYSSSVADAAARALSFTLGAGNGARLVTGSKQVVANDALDPSSLAITGLTNKEYLFVRGIASESETTTITVTAGYTSIGSVLSDSAGVVSANMVVAGEYDVVTATGSTSNPTVVAADGASVFFALEEYVLPIVDLPSAGSITIEGQAPTLFEQDFAQPASSVLSVAGQAPSLTVSNLVYPAAENLTTAGQAPSLTVSSLVLPTTGSFAIEGQAPTALVTIVEPVMLANSSLAGGTAATTAQLTPPAGKTTAAFTQGLISEDTNPLTVDIGLNGYTELEWALKLTSLATDGNYEFRIVYNGSPITLSATPILTKGQAAINIPIVAGAVNVTGQAPTLRFDLKASPNAGAINATGQAPTLVVGQFLQAVGGAVNVTGQAPSLKLDLYAQPAVRNLALAGQAPMPLVDTLGVVPAAFVTITGQAPSLKLDLVASPAVGSLTITGQAPSISPSRNILAVAGSITITGQAPVSKQDQYLALTAGSVTLAGQAPSLLINNIVSPASRQVSTTGQAPTLYQAVVLTPATGNYSFTGQAPVAFVEYRVYPQVRSLTLAGQAPTLKQDVYKQPGAGILTIASVAPVAFVENRVQPNAGTITLAGRVPTLIANDNHQILVPEGDIALTSSAPVVFAELKGTILTGSVLIEGQEPSLKLFLVASPTASTLTTNGSAPTLVVSDNAVPQPTAGSANFAGSAPYLSRQFVVSPQEGTVLVASVAPIASEGAIIEVPEATTFIVGEQPSVDVSDIKIIDVGTGLVALEGQVPNLSAFLDYYIMPPAGVVQIESYAPGTAPVTNTILRTCYFNVAGTQYKAVGTNVILKTCYFNVGGKQVTINVTKAVAVNQDFGITFDFISNF